MVFSFIVTRRLLLGDCKVIYGTYANDSGSTGGPIETEIKALENFTLTPIAAAVATDVSTVNGTLTQAGNKKVIVTTTSQGNVIIVTPANQSGFWCAFGV
jgi:hypothetical protein